MHARYYWPLYGRFTSPDPIGGNPWAPQSWNRYAYVMNNPTNYVDPYGLEIECTRLDCTDDEPVIVTAPFPYDPSAAGGGRGGLGGGAGRGAGRGGGGRGGGRTGPVGEPDGPERELPSAGGPCVFPSSFPSSVVDLPRSLSFYNTLSRDPAARLPAWGVLAVRSLPGAPLDHKQEGAALAFENYGNWAFGARMRAARIPRFIAIRAGGFANWVAEGQGSIGAFVFGPFPFNDEPNDPRYVLGGYHLSDCTP